MEENLLRKYRPRRLADVLGQPDAARALGLFAARPYTAAFLFHGDTGVGKTATAYALAEELGCVPAEEELGGVYEIPSGEMGADEVREQLRLLRYRPLLGTGWRVLICNEADRMTKSAETIWLDGLEHLPGMTVVVFTTNQPERLSKRFRDRCECLRFESSTARLRPALRELARKVWAAEIGVGQPPLIDTLGLPTLTGPDSMHASFRLAMQQLQKLIREARDQKAKGALAP